MAAWTRKSSEPLTTESRVLVVTRCGGCEGYASVRWNGGQPKLYGSVYSEEQFFDESGNQYREPEKKVIDSQPRFVA